MSTTTIPGPARTSLRDWLRSKAGTPLNLTLDGRLYRIGREYANDALLARAASDARAALRMWPGVVAELAVIAANSLPLVEQAGEVRGLIDRKTLDALRLTNQAGRLLVKAAEAAQADIRQQAGDEAGNLFAVQRAAPEAVARLRTARTAAFLARDVEAAWQRAADDIRRRFADAINGVPVATAHRPRKRRKRVRRSDSRMRHEKQSNSSS